MKKNEEIDRLISLELENAEMKAKTLLENLNIDQTGSTGEPQKKIIEQKNLPQFTLSTFEKQNTLNQQNQLTKKTSEQSLKILSLNAGCQTTEQYFSSDYVFNLEKNVVELKQRIEKNKKEFNDYKDKSHKILVSNEENYNKILNENQTIKKRN